ncbi:MAG: replication initiator protein A [Cetobacterium sp.]|nr:replication initiator protein A [Cetobacterium sp.]
MKKIENLDMEIIDTGETEIVEEYLDFPEEELIEQAHKNLVRIDMNIIEYPIFSKNRKRKINQVVVYYFNKRKDKYIEVKPISGSTIPGEFEERVFLALIKIMKRRNYGREFVVTASEILDNLNLETRSSRAFYRNEIRDSLIKLSETSYTFKNSLYSNELGGLIESAVITNIMNITIITRKTKSHVDFDHFKDRRIKEIYKVSLSDHFYKNIIKKGYLVYNADLLLDINTSTARGIYMMINKWRFNKLYLSQPIVTILKRIPLKHSKSYMTRSVNTLISACEELKKKKLIKDFNIIKKTTWESAEIEFFFEESHNQLKQNNFFQDKNSFKGLAITDVAEDYMDAYAISDEDIEEIINLLPSKAKTLSTIKKTIIDMSTKYKTEDIKKAAHYTKLKKATKVRSYFIKALENSWGEDIELPKKEKKLNLDFSLKQEENISFKHYELFIKLSSEDQNSIENLVYKDYIQQCGGFETSIQKKAFNFGKTSLIDKFLEKNPEFLIKKEPVKPEQIDEKNRTTNLTLLKEYVYEYIDTYAFMLEIPQDTLKGLKIDIMLKLTKSFMNKTLTIESIDEILNSSLKSYKKP